MKTGITAAGRAERDGKRSIARCDEQRFLGDEALRAGFCWW
ncbi:hypothetical protein [Nocardioides alcanivorans]|nr:hypothetical protein [Nocardioides alcanivorans]